MYKTTTHLLLLLFTFLISITSVYAQGVLKGSVSDSLTAKPLFGANCVLLGTAQGSATDFEGEYRIPNVSPGDYVLRISYIGYVTKEFNVTIADNRTLEFDVLLIPDVIEGETVVITAQASGQAAAINQQITSNTIVNVVSEEKIQELPDANAAESIGRLPGVSLLRSGGEANKIILRGLSDKYTNVTIDGVRIPSTDATSRGLDLSTLSQSSLAGIELYKALTADKDADAIAGSVNLVTKKAPKKRSIKFISKGGYNDLMSSVEQYDFSLRYGERFLDELLGVQLSGNIENKFRSSERINLSYDQTILNQTDYFINNFTLQFTDERRTRNGAGVILDVETPDDGVIKLSTNYNSTKRDYLTSTRDYPNGGGNSQVGGVTYSYRDREQTIETFSSALTGDNYLYDFELNYGLSFAQSVVDFPYDYQMDFAEPSISGSAGMMNTPQLKDHPEDYIQYAYNNFRAATLSQAFYRTQNNFQKDRTAYLNITKEYNLGDLFSGIVKAGGKYKTTDRTNSNTLKYAPYYLGFWQPYEKLSDGTIAMKDLSGTSFDAFWQRYLESSQNKSLSFSEVLDGTPKARDIFDDYALNPIINRDMLREWYKLNKNGVAKSGLETNLEYFNDKSVQADNYDITESVASGYLMNTLNIGQDVTFIAGLRVEQENNDYKNKYSKLRFAGFPVPNATTRDTTTSYTETIWLPNFHLNIKATDYLNIRLAAYRALARPDFTMRLNTYFAWRPAASGSDKQLFVGNPKLKTAKAWNFEINTSFFGNEIGLVSFSAFYKEIKDMYHMMNQLNTVGDTVFIGLGLDYESLHQGTYQLTIPYNSPEPTKVWGFEFEHQINFTFLPGYLKNIVLSYNGSLVKSETSIVRTVTDTVKVQLEGFPFPIETYEERVVNSKQQLENQPEMYGNISLGYDIGGFSARLSLFHQSEYNLTFSSNGRSDRIIEAYTRLDLAVKYKFTDYLSAMVSVSNLTNIKEDNYLHNKPNDYKILRSSELYGLTADFGLRVDL